METGLHGVHGHHVQLLVGQQLSIVSHKDCSSKKKTHFTVELNDTGTRSCVGASNGGVCLGSAIDTRLCDAGVNCNRKLLKY